MMMGACLARKRLEEEAARLSKEFEENLSLNVPLATPSSKRRGGKRHKQRQRVGVGEDSIDESRQRENTCCTPLPSSVGVRRCGLPEGLQSPDLCIQLLPADPIITEARACSSCFQDKLRTQPIDEAEEDGSLLSEDYEEES